VGVLKLSYKVPKYYFQPSRNSKIDDDDDDDDVACIEDNSSGDISPAGKCNALFESGHESVEGRV
jgi:hypothetical protein